MIPNPRPYMALYRHTNTLPDGTDHAYTEARPVIAWGDDGHALVADTTTGQLRPAAGYANFGGLTLDNSAFIAAMPGAGWTARYKDGDGTDFTHPILAWAFRANGSCVPMAAGLDGYVDEVHESDNFIDLHPPRDIAAEQ